MTGLINQITINGQTTTFLNYVNPLVPGEDITDTYDFTSFFVTHFGDDRQKFTMGTVGVAIRFPTSFETKTGNIPTFTTYTTPSSARLIWSPTIERNVVCHNNGNSSTSTTYGFTNTFGNLLPRFTFVVINSLSIVGASFTNNTRTTLAWFRYMGWPKSMIYTGSQYPRNFINILQRSVTPLENGSNWWMQRPTTENNTAKSNLYTASDSVLAPDIDCVSPTSGANATDIIIRDAVSPYNYLGNLCNVIRLPNSCIVGKIYKNTGVDPDTGLIETDEKAFWMCIRPWGNYKLGMRVWTENIT